MMGQSLVAAFHTDVMWHFGSRRWEEKVHTPVSIYRYAAKVWPLIEIGAKAKREHSASRN